MDRPRVATVIKSDHHLMGRSADGGKARSTMAPASGRNVMTVSHGKPLIRTSPPGKPARQRLRAGSRPRSCGPAPFELADPSGQDSHRPPKPVHRPIDDAPVEPVGREPDPPPRPT